MAEQTIKRGEPAELVATGGDACTLSIVREDSARWRIRLMAHLTQGGARTLGVIHTSPHSVSKGAPSRVIAAASLPGVAKWSAIAECLSSAGTITLELMTAHGLAVPSFVDFEYRRSEPVSGVDGPVSLLPGQRLASLSAMAVAPGATVTLDGGAPVVIPVGGIQMDLRNRYGTALVFAGTTHYLLEVEG